MLMKLALATVMVMLTVLMHGGGLALLSRLMRLETRLERNQHVPPMSVRAMGFTILVVLALFFIHGLEIWLYAGLYWILGAVSDLETAVYFSTISYAAIGFEDSYMIPSWRLLCGIEGINGVILLGWSTAFFITVMRRIH